MSWAKARGDKANRAARYWAYIIVSGNKDSLLKLYQASWQRPCLIMGQCKALHAFGISSNFKYFYPYMITSYPMCNFDPFLVVRSLV